MQYLFMGPMCTLTFIDSLIFYVHVIFHGTGIFLFSILMAFLLYNCCTCTLKWEICLPVS